MNELKEALLKISVGRNGKDWVDEPVDAIMKEISPVIESLLKKQRENCAREAKRGYDYEQEKLILNAPEPGEG